MLSRSRLVLIGLMAVFAVPPVLALVFYAGVGSWFAPGSVNRGSLLEPPRPAPRDALVLTNGDVLPSEFLDRRWTLVYLAVDACRRPCEKNLEAMRQAHRALGRNRTRVQRLLLLAAASPAPAVADHPVARVTPAWDRALRDDAGDEGERTSGIWLVDPRRFVILRFASGAGPRAIKHDLDRLLKLSKWQTG